MTQRNEKVANSLKEFAANFLGRENNKTSLITVTSATVSPDLKRATIFITVFPISKEASALLFVKRKLGELREFLKKNMPIKIIPFLDVVIDQGEKNRQKIDELLRNG
ncbi:MAG: Ribosome-binding factor A [Candidatus Nomurabacteria bacterium GW2011_GWB1_43_7]|uniref:Ribosome-binding factor A n=1 Tax=Candidatus Nomurabacteria bacterium GW2011_GWB1_43_7 TaxID=1618747 RepID=A0A0G1F840_9BACT|nr:MAG: Ribosome-binding factor A [Candidatus Nomurabacteria bacterium GW2011_GWB1_43_7]